MTDEEKKPALEAWQLQWRLDQCQRMNSKLWKLLDERLEEDTKADILEELGRSCAEGLGWAKQYQGNPEGFFEHMYEHAGEVITYDRKAGIITVTTKERECECCLIDNKCTPSCYCSCSVGWQKYTYEIILGKKVKVQVKESALRGCSRCVFVITIQEDAGNGLS